MAEKYKVVKAIKGYYTSADAKNRKSARTTVKIGTYYIFNKYNGMINVTSKKGTPGSWINPADNKTTTKKSTTKKTTTKKTSKTTKKPSSSTTTQKKTIVNTSVAKAYRINAFGDKVLRGYIVREDNGKVLTFQFNPDSWQRNYKAVYTSPDSPGSPYPEINYIRQDKRNFTLKISYDKRIDSQFCKDVNDIVKAYENLTQPSSSYSIMQRGSKKFVSPPTCKFVFGDEVIKCKVAEVKTNRTAFDKNLKIIACMIEMEVLEVV